METQNEENKQENHLNYYNNLSDLVISVAPMLDVTNTHFRMLCRIISKKTELWTEMVVDDTIIHCYDDEVRRHLLEKVHLQKNKMENPLVLQLGGNNPTKLEKAIEIAYKYGFCHFNLNVGCPSIKVASRGSFGASLYKNPIKVARIVDACNKKLIDLGLINTRISIKTRIGVDQFDTYHHLYNFISLVSGINIDNQNKKDYSCIFPEIDENELSSLDYSKESFKGATTFIIHARKAWLNGINPSKNRNIPKLKYYWVYMLTLHFPSLNFILNGGITSIEESISILKGEWYIDWYFKSKDNIQEIDFESTKIKKIKTCENDFNLIQDYETLYHNIILGKWNNRIKGIMIGREVMNNPFILSKVDNLIYGMNNNINYNNSNYDYAKITRRIVLERYGEYLSQVKPRNIQDQGKFTIGELSMYLKPVFGIFHGFPGTKYWRRTLSEFIQKSKKDDHLLNLRGPREILIESLNLFEKEYSCILDST